MKSRYALFLHSFFGNSLSKIVAVVWLTMLGTLSLSAINVTGTVSDTNGEPMIGVSVLEKGTTNGTVTDNDGHFALEVAGTQSVLVISYVGYITQEVTVGNRRTLTVTMEENAALLNEVVVIGYGTQRKADVTSAVTSVKDGSFNRGAVLDAGQLVQGKVAGLQISLSSGDPSASTSVMLRGNSSLYGTTDPLILVDGVPGNFSTVDPSEIESVDVLKDGSATAIYGTRGTNGVIIITTKNAGRIERSSIEYSGYVSAITMAKRPDFMTAEDFRYRLANQSVLAYDKDTKQYTEQRWEDVLIKSQQGALSPDPAWGFSNPDEGATVDYLGEITRTALTHVHNLTYRGGGKNLSFIGTATYESRQGTMKETDVQNMRIRLEMVHRMYDNKLITTASVIANEQLRSPGFDTGIYRRAVIQNPTQPIYDANGNYVERSVYFYDNPVSLINERIGETRQRNVRFTGSMEFKPIEGLSLKAMYTRKGQGNVAGYYLTKKHPTTTESGYNGYATRSAYNYINNLVELTASYNKNIGLHTFSAVAGYNYEDNMTEGFDMNNRNFPTDGFLYNNMETGLGLKQANTLAGMSSYKYMDKLIGLFARATYNFDDRYLLMVSVRHEGSSKFGANHKWGTFPGVSVGWRLNNEEFMKEYTWLNNLKLRAGYGVTGINAGARYASLSAVSYGGPSNDSYFLYGGSWIQTLLPTRNANPDLHWEKKLEYNLGVDFDLFSSRLGGSIDIYRRDTKDGLWNYSVPVPPYQYGSILANVVQIRNQGFEFALNAVPVRTRDFQWNTNMTYSINKNKVVSLSNEQFQMSTDYFDEGYVDEPIQQSSHRIQVGEPIGNFYGLKSVGVDEHGLWVVEMLDTDANGKVTKSYGLAENSGSKDKQILGNGVPKWFLNWNNTFTYKNFDLSINMRGAFDFDILNYQKMFYGTSIIYYNFLNAAWDPMPVVDAKTGVPTGQKTLLRDSQRYVSYYVEKGDYWKIDNITLGYTFQPKSKYIQRIRMYASCLNLATFTGYDGLDPEVQITGRTPGLDNRDKYPTNRSFTFGLNVTF